MIKKQLPRKTIKVCEQEEIIWFRNYYSNRLSIHSLIQLNAETDI